MRFFGKKDKFEDIEPSLLNEEDFYIGAKKAGENVLKSHGLTADEIIGNQTNSYDTEAENPLEALKKKMISRNSKPKKEEPSDKENEALKSFFNINDSFLDDSETKEEEEFSEIIEMTSDDLEAYPEIEIPKEENKQQVNDPQEKAQTEDESLLKNCLPFIMDGNNGEFVPDDKPTYSLDSVASILGIEEPQEEIVEQDKPEETEQDIEKTMIFSYIVSKPDELPDISDIDTDAKIKEKKPLSNTATMPVIIPDEAIGSTRDIAVPNEISKPKDIENFGISQAEIEDEYKNYTPEFEYRCIKDRKKIKFKLVKERRSCFIKFIITLSSLIVLGFFGLPVFNELKLSFSTVLAVFTSICYLTAVISNWDVFLSFTSLFSKRTSAEAGIALAVILTLPTMVLSFTNLLHGEVYYGLSVMTVLTLTFRSYFCFKRSQYIFTNFLKISSNTEKYGIALIDDAPTTFAMARKAIDGDILIAAPQKTSNITNFIKNSTFDIDLEGKARLLFVVSLCFSLLAGIAFGVYRDNFMTGIITCCAFVFLFAPLTTLACSILPLSSAAAHLNRYGAVLTGMRAAKQIEAANALVIDCGALFPKGSIKLSNMQVLSENNLEETIAYACAITTNIKSPLAPIFEKIMATNKEIKVPLADSIKYEERLGITGWVGKKRIFIGNRALMLAHEIPVADAERDKKLMREGYFPVYVACDGKACALLTLKYIPNPNVAKELDRITAMGLTVLVNNCDQNISDEMICDYFDLYEDSVKIMSSSGVHMYKTAMGYTENMNAGAVVRFGAAGMAATVFCANRVKKANLILQTAHIISVILGVIIFSYIIFGNSAPYINGIYVALYQLACFIISGIAYLFTKP